jgi:serine/threonine protein kinase
VHLGDELSFRERVDLCADVARGVAYVHSRNIVHADLKSGNVLVSAALTAMLADMGLARHLGTMTDRALVGVGGPYCAPERRGLGPGAAAVGAAPRAWDVYSLGVICVEILSGLEPPARDLEPPAAAAAAVAAAGAGTGELPALLASARALDPASRPTAEGLLAALLAARAAARYGASPPRRALAVTEEAGRPRRFALAVAVPPG